MGSVDEALKFCNHVAVNPFCRGYTPTPKAVLTPDAQANTSTYKDRSASCMFQNSYKIPRFL